jgi:hypothetical protein
MERLSRRRYPSPDNYRNQTIPRYLIPAFRVATVVGTVANSQAVLELPEKEPSEFRGKSLSVETIAELAMIG